MTRLRALIEGLKRVETVKEYPFKRIPAPQSFRGLLSIDVNKCHACGACAHACPAKAISVEAGDGVVVVKHLVYRCIFCAWCADICPYNAITMSSEYELPTRDMGNLVQLFGQSGVDCRECGATFTSAKAWSEVQKTVSLREDYSRLCPSCRALKVSLALARSRRGWA